MSVGSVTSVGYTESSQAQNAAKIKSLQRQIQDLEDKISEVNASDEYDADDKTTLVSQYQSQITTLQTQITNLQNTGQASAAEQAQALREESAQDDDGGEGGTGLFEPGQFLNENA